MTFFFSELTCKIKEMSCVTENKRVHEQRIALSKNVSYIKENVYAKIFFLESVLILNLLGKSEA